MTNASSDELSPELKALLEEGMGQNAAEGKRTLIPQGVYDEVTITDVRPYPVDRESDQERGVKARLHIKTHIEDCDPDVDTSFYVPYFGPNPGPSSVQARLWIAAFGEGGAAAGKTAADLVGCKIRLIVEHKNHPKFGQYCARSFMPHKSRKAPAK